MISSFTFNCIKFKKGNEANYILIGNNGKSQLDDYLLLSVAVIINYLDGGFLIKFEDHI